MRACIKSFIRQILYYRADLVQVGCTTLIVVNVGDVRQLVVIQGELDVSNARGCEAAPSIFPWDDMRAQSVLAIPDSNSISFIPPYWD